MEVHDIDTILLGLLLMQPQTVYELRGNIRASFQSICSDSMGSIQAAIKKLLAAGHITLSEEEARGVKKKIYHVTEGGRRYFQQWVCSSMDLGKTKNMDAGKLLFMGFVPAAMRPSLIRAVIEDQRRQLAEMEALQASLHQNAEGERAQYLAGLDEGHRGMLEKTTGCTDAKSNVEDIFDYQMLALKLGIDTAKFHIQWFGELAKSLDAQGEANT